MTAELVTPEELAQIYRLDVGDWVIFPTAAGRIRWVLSADGYQAAGLPLLLSIEPFLGLCWNYERDGDCISGRASAALVAAVLASTSLSS